MAMSPNGIWLYVCNTPDGYLEAYVLTDSGAVHVESIPVGLEPVAVAARNDNEVWVVNHLSDSVSIVDTSVFPPRVVRTLLVGDEPRDIVFAGPGGNLAFITTAHRGQNTPWRDGDYDVPGVGRADVWVFDATSLGTAMGGTPLTVVNLFGDRPRALAASPDGSKVYAAVFRSGNQTVAINEGLVCDLLSPLQSNTTTCSIEGNTYPGRRLLPVTDHNGDLGRETGIIVGFNPSSSHWEDEIGRNWDTAVPFDIPDYDVFEIDANAGVPVQLGPVAGGIIEGVPGVGTILFNMIVNPANGDVYVSNTDTNNRVRFEGPGDYVTDPDSQPKPSSDPATVRSNLHKARITVLDASVDNVLTPETEFDVLPRHLNKHLLPFYGAPAFGTPPSEKAKSLATPLQMAITSDGSTLYVAGFGSNGVGVYDTAQLKSDTFVPSAANIIPIPGGPSGLLLDNARDRLYVTSRITNATYIFDTTTNSPITCPTPPCTFVLGMHNPEPPEITAGRPFLYDATLTSANGEASCGGCHIFGDMDDISWDLGDPDGNIVAPNPNPKPLVSADAPGLGGLPDAPRLDSMKGPMTTQSLRGLAFSGPMHWRGDRTGSQCFFIDTVGNSDCEDQAFNAFNVAFPGLLGRDTQLATANMQAFTDFALRLTYPPNPIRALDNSMTPQEQAGFDLYTDPLRLTDQVANCNGCHVLDRSQGFFGTSGGTTFENETMEFKVAHLRNAYQKVGMFGQMPLPFIPAPGAPGVDMGPQVRATGFLHDGSISTVKTFLSASVFDTTPTEEANLEAFIMAFDSDLAPIVGQQITLTDTNLTEVEPRIDLLIQRCATECNLVVKGVIGDERRGWLGGGQGTCDSGSNAGNACVTDGECPGSTCNLGGFTFLSDGQAEALWTKNDLLAVAAVPGQALTFTAVPPGTGFRIGINRDRDFWRDFDDSFPSVFQDPNSFLCSIGPSSPAATSFGLLFLIGLGLLARFMVVGRRQR
jgi:DNA-binding beta-propeller fold protein YncE/mono/diheme cytochrome c family protein